MVQVKKLLLCIGLVAGISGCSCNDRNYNVEFTPVQKGDKQLSCKDIILEMNEAEFYRKESEERKKGKLEDMLLPYCYPSGYLSARNSGKISKDRLEYLQKIYEVMECDTKLKYESRRLPPPPTVYQQEPLPPGARPIPNK